MKLFPPKFADAWSKEFDRMIVGIDWFAMPVPNRARMLNQLRSNAMRKMTGQASKREVLRCRPDDLKRIEATFHMRAQRYGLTAADFRQIE